MTLKDDSDDGSSDKHVVSWNGEERRDDGASTTSDVLALELDRLITDYFELQREGRAPSPDKFIASHPEHEHALRAVLPGASLLDRLGKLAEDSTPFSRSGERLGEYKLLGILGRGGMGVVYEAVQEALNRPVALKVLPASRVIDRKSRERFMREAQAAASLQHPGIVPVFGVGEADGQVYYAMQRIDGVPLDLLTAAVRGESLSSESSLILKRAAALAAKLRMGRIDGSSSKSVEGSTSSSVSRVASTCDETGDLHGADQGGRSWIENAVRIVLQAAEALSYAHSRGVLHRDVKPCNLMIEDDGRVFVTDFGLCKTADNSSLTAAGDVVGTLRYVPPERFQGRDDARGDVYGVGLILYELLCGRAAFPQGNRAELVRAVTLDSPPRPRRINRDIPEDLERIVLAATAKLPEERYASTEALIADLTAFLAARPIHARAPGKLYTDDQALRAFKIEGGRAAPKEGSVPIAEAGQERLGGTSVSLDVAGGWIVTGAADGVCRTWSVLSGRPGPRLLSVFGGIGAAEFPEPGKPPVVLEYRGRVSHFELDGVDRSGGAPGCIPNEAEKVALQVVSGRARLDFIKAQLERSDLTLGEARLLEMVSSGIHFYARYNPQLVSPVEAKAAHTAATDRLIKLGGLEGP